MEHDQRKEATTVHHHFTISHDGAPRQPGSLRETQDLLLASGLLNMERSSSAQMAHEHRFHQLRDDQDREQLKERIREKEPGKTHVFLDSFRSVDAIAGGPLSHLLQDVASVRRCLRWALRIVRLLVFLVCLFSHCVPGAGDGAAVHLRAVFAGRPKVPHGPDSQIHRGRGNAARGTRGQSADR
jgi:hypothetical protein